MYSLMSSLMRALSSSKRNSARARASSVLPTPVGPRKMNEPIGRLGSLRPARARRTASATASTARSWPIDPAVQVLLHAEQLVGLFLPACAAPGCRSTELTMRGDVVGVDRGVGDALVGEPGVLGLDEGLLDLVGLLLELGGLLVVLRLHGGGALARELAEPQLHLAQLGRQHGRLDAQLAGRLVEQVDGLVGQEAVADVAVGQPRRLDAAPRR